ncbi:hypothetical protein, partial [Lapidilactobacillus wuchangensis]|uniref:hypothetical protein n=1 Tax=Lapidilactobacillus wuchangensis TaxID=2486001 RepID=UPI001CDC6782
PAIGVNGEIILAALAVRIRLVFEIVALAISSNQRPPCSTPSKSLGPCRFQLGRLANLVLN